MLPRVLLPSRLLACAHAEKPEVATSPGDRTTTVRVVSGFRCATRGARASPFSSWEWSSLRGQAPCMRQASPSTPRTTSSTATGPAACARVCRGRPFSSAATASRCAAECEERSVPFGKYWLSRPFAFSLEPRCQGPGGRRGRPARRSRSRIARASGLERLREKSHRGSPLRLSAVRRPETGRRPRSTAQRSL